MRPYNEHIPFIQFDTALSRVPRAWLQVIEPKIKRGVPPIPTCWLWADAIGPLDCDSNGEPRLRVEGVQVLVKHFVAKLFWPNIKCTGKNPLHFVFHHCGTKNCLNPNHFLVLFDHPSQVNLEQTIKDKRISLRRWRARERWRQNYGDAPTSSDA